jgi:hypothetical protein
MNSRRAAAERIEADRDGALARWRLTVERANYEAQRAERRLLTRLRPDRARSRLI